MRRDYLRRQIMERMKRYVLESGFLKVGIDPAAGDDVTVFHWSDVMADHIVIEAEDPVRVVIVELFDNRVFYVSGVDRTMKGTQDLGSRAQILTKEAMSYYREDDVPSSPLTKFTAENWERARFEALPADHGYGKIVDGVWPADALAIPGVCPRTDGHHRPDTRGRFCTACGRRAMNLETKKC